jgi:hypothetical protein
MTALVLAAVILGGGGMGIWMRSRRRRENTMPPEGSGPTFRSGRRRRED